MPVQNIGIPSSDEDNSSDNDTLDVIAGRKRAKVLVSSNVTDHESSSDDDDSEWSKNILLHADRIENSSFDTVIKPTWPFSVMSSPVQYFDRFFDEDVFQLISDQTNIYAEQYKTKNWIPSTSAEIRALLGIHILMGLHNLPQEHLYWSTNPLYFVKFIADVMPYKRYRKLMENIHVADNSKAPKKGHPEFDKLYKLRVLINILKEQFKTEATQSASVSVDECMIKFKGRSSLKQYMPMKPFKRGYKAWAIAESTTGYLYDFEIYTGKIADKVEEGLGPSVVLRLTKTLKFNGGSL